MPINYNINSTMPIGQGSPIGEPYGMGDSMMGGPAVSGKWTNKRTGKTVIVRDSVIDGDNMIIITDNGTIDMNTFSRDYIQASDEIYDEAGHVVGTSTAQASEIVQVDNLQQNNTNVLNDPTIYVNNEQEIPNYKLIDKIFKKTNSKPTIKFEIEWADFPTDKLQMLVDCFDVTTDDISTYINKHFINQDSVVESLNCFLKTKGVE